MTNDEQPRKRKWPMGCAIIAGIILLLGIIGAIAGGGGSGGSGSSTAATSERSDPPLEVSAAEVARAYEANEARAQKQYGDRPLLVTGTVAGVDLDMMNKPILQLTTGGALPAGAALTEASQVKAADLDKGVKVTLLCQGVQEVVSIPQFSDCELQ